MSIFLRELPESGVMLSPVSACAQLLLVTWLQQLIIDSVVHQHSRVTWLKSERIVLITGTGNDNV